MSRILKLLVIVALNAACCEAQLTASLDDENFLVLEATGLELLAVEFQSASGSLIPSEDPTPFQGVLVQDSSLSLYYNLGTPFFLDGSLRLNTQWDPTKRNDIQFQYGTPAVDEDLQPIVGHQLFAGQVSTDPVIVTETGGASGDDDDATFTSQEIASKGPIVIASPSLDGVYLYGDQPISVVSLTVRSNDGFLVPSGPSALFESVDSATPFEVSYNSSTDVSLRGDFYLPVGWSGSDLGDLEISLLTSSGEYLSAEFDSTTLAPEPATRAGMLFAFIVLMAIHRRRRL